MKKAYFLTLGVQTMNNGLEVNEGLLIIGKKALGHAQLHKIFTL